MSVIPHDRGTFLVESRSRPDEHHIVDIEEKTCSCEAFQFHQTCQHLEKLMSNEITELELAPPTEGEAPMKQLAPYDEFKTKIESLRKTAESITVTDISQTSEMRLARTARLEIRQIRIAIEHRHKDLKADVLAQGRKIDQGKNELLAVLEPLELRLKDQEEFVERETVRIQAEKRVARLTEISPYLLSPPMIDLGVVKDDAYAGMLSDAIAAHAARLDRERREKEEAEARAKAEAEERERIRVENDRLKKEAAEAEVLRLKNEAAMGEIQGIQHQIMIAQIGRVGVRKGGTIDCIRATLKETEEWTIDDRFGDLKESAHKTKENAITSIKGLLETAEKEAEAARALKAEREVAEAKLHSEREAAERLRKEAAEKARKEREEIEAKARAEREAAEAKARQERSDAAKKAKAEREAREKAEAELADARAKERAAEMAEADRLDREAKAKAEAEKAPDKEKLLAFAAKISSMEIPELTSESGRACLNKIGENLRNLAAWVTTKAREL